MPTTTNEFDWTIMSNQSSHLFVWKKTFEDLVILINFDICNLSELRWAYLLQVCGKEVFNSDAKEFVVRVL